MTIESRVLQENEDVRTTAVEPGSEATRAKARWWSSERLRESYTAIAFVVIFAVYGIWLGPLFLNVDARLYDIHGNAPLVLLGLAVLATLVAGHFDLSTASLCSLATFLVVGLTVNQGWPFPFVLVFVLVLGALAGLLNGLLVTKLRINAFIATLGTGGVFAGASRVYSGGNAISPSPSTGTLPEWFMEIGQFATKPPTWIVTCALVLASIAVARALMLRTPRGVGQQTWRIASVAIAAALGLALFLTHWLDKASVAILLVVAVAGLTWILIRSTVFGRYVRATGHNAEAASLAGVKTDRVTVQAFVLGGVLAALAGLVLAANLGSAQPGVGQEFLLPAFAAAFLSTVILSPGLFTVWGTVFGSIFVIWISQGLVIGGVAFTWTGIVQGLALVITVALSTLFRRGR